VGSVWAVNAGPRRQVHAETCAESADSARKVCVVGKPEIYRVVRRNAVRVGKFKRDGIMRRTSTEPTVTASTCASIHRKMPRHSLTG
jgi:hypothetical protein